MTSAHMRMTAGCVAFFTGGMIVAISRSSADLGTFVMAVGGAMILADWLPSWWADRLSRASTPGTCAKCGYDLTGNASGVCPECGTPAQQPPR